MKGKDGLKFILVILVIGILTSIAAFGAPFLGIPSINDMRFGIDIKGGVYANLYPDLPEGQKPSAEELDAAEEVITRRLDAKGIFDKNVIKETQYGRLIVEIPYTPGQKDLNPQAAINEIGKTALLTFQEVDETMVDEKGNYLPTGKIVIEGKHVEDAGVVTNTQTGEILVSLKLNAEGTKLFADATSRMVGKPIAIFMDDEPVLDSDKRVNSHAPIVNEAITGGEATISGQRDAKQAGELAAVINAGRLPFRLIAKGVNSITPTLGQGALTVAIYAGIVSFILVFLFMLLVYRLPGLIAGIAVFGLVVGQLVVLSAFGISLTLPGIAGIILSVGMGVDANVIIFERIKEELRSGKTLGASIDAGFKRAFAAILDSNVTTVITGVVLYALGSGPIKGFAYTLILGVILSFITAVTASRLMLRGISKLDVAKNKWLYGA